MAGRLQCLEQWNRVAIDLMRQREDSGAHGAGHDHEREEWHDQGGISGQNLVADTEVVEGREEFSGDHLVENCHT
jgi:hypothetical protein